MMLDCWVTERKNGIAKGCIEHVCVAKVFETSALKRISAQQVRGLNQRHSLGEYLLPPIVDVPELALELGLGVAMVAKAMVWRSTPLASGDLIVVVGVFGLVVACLSLDDAPYVLLESFDHVQQVLHCIASVLGGGFVVKVFLFFDLGRMSPYAPIHSPSPPAPPTPPPPSSHIHPPPVPRCPKNQYSGGPPHDLVHL